MSRTARRHQPAIPESWLGLPLADGMLLLTILIWSANVSFVKLLLRYWPGFALATMRMLLALIAFAVVIAFTEGSIRVRRQDAKLLLFAAFFGIFMNQAAFVLALHFTKASGVALLLSMIPVFVAGISAGVGFEPFSRWSLAGLPISLAGVAVIIGTEPGAHLGVGTIRGDLFALLTALSWAVYTVALQPLLRHYSPARISFWVVAMGLLGLIPAAAASGHLDRVLHAPWWTWILVAYSSLGAIALTNLLWYTGTHRLGPARGSTYAFLQPFLGAVMAVLILSERLSALEIGGGVLVIAGIVVGRRRHSAPVIAEQSAEVEMEGR